MTILRRFLTRRRHASRAMRWLPHMDYLLMLERRGYISADDFVRGIQRGRRYICETK